MEITTAERIKQIEEMTKPADDGETWQDRARREQELSDGFNGQPSRRSVTDIDDAEY